MRLITVTWLKANASIADVIETFVRYHAQYVDRMIFVPMYEDAETIDILQSMQREKMPVSMYESIKPSLYNRMQRDAVLHNVAAQLRPRWIVELQTHECMHANNSVHDALNALPEDMITLLPRTTYMPRAGKHTHEGNLLKRMPYRLAEERTPHLTPIIPHAISSRADWRGGAQLSTDLRLAHFPLRSMTQSKDTGHVLTYDPLPADFPIRYPVESVVIF